MVKAVTVLLLPCLLVATVVCEVEEDRVTCTYFITRSDKAYDTYVEFHWFSPNGNEDRIKLFQVPPYCGSVYDYIYLPQKGRWKVRVKELESNVTSITFFEVNQSDEEFFED
ncbi:MAG: hypothetical protein GXO61_06085 [Epsilonproteobacteria bacterium]|nr:hypothetical protein [Campylobacterota bacterium]